MDSYFRRIQADIKSIRFNAELIKEQIDEAKLRLESLRESYDELVRRRSGDEFNKKVLEDVVYESSEYILRIFEDEFEYAMGTSREFNFPQFERAFFDALRGQEEFIEFSIDDNVSVNVNINLEKVGTIEDYVNGVEYARSIFRDTSFDKELEMQTVYKNMGKKRRNAPTMTSRRASTYWRNIVYGQYGGPLYTRTIQLRLDGFKNKAPFWFILDSGTPPNLASDWNPRGEPYPITKPTRFTTKAKVRIKEYVKNTAENSIEKIKQLFVEEENELDISISDIKNDIKLLMVLLDEATKSIGGDIKSKEVPTIERARETFDEHLEYARKLGAREEKVKKLWNDIVTGAVVKARVYLGYGVRKRTINLLKEIKRILQGS